MRSTVFAALLLAAIAVGGVGAESHRHDAPALSTGHEHLPTFAAGHEDPDRTVHIEGATRIESPSCIVCLQRQRHNADGSLEPSLGGFEPSSSPLAVESARRVAFGESRLPASRAPPRA